MFNQTQQLTSWHCQLSADIDGAELDVDINDSTRKLVKLGQKLENMESDERECCEKMNEDARDLSKGTNKQVTTVVPFRARMSRCDCEHRETVLCNTYPRYIVKSHATYEPHDEVNDTVKLIVAEVDF